MKRLILFLALASCLLLACNGVVVPDTLTPIPTRIPPLTSTSTFPPEVAEIVLQEVADLICPNDDLDLYDRRFSATDTTYSFGCSPAAGHYTGTTLQRFSNEDEARDAFEEQRGEDTVGEFHGFPLLAWDEHMGNTPSPSQPTRPEYRIWLWQAQQWLIKVRAFDDTWYLIAPAPEEVSEAIYQVGLEHGLFTVSGQ